MPEGRSQFDLGGRVAVVTGGASGLGQAISIGLGQVGARVVIADINEPGAAQTAALIRDQGASALVVRCDIADAEEVRRLFDRAEAEFGTVGILVNNALLPPYREHPETYPLDAWEASLRVNLTGYFLCAREAGRRMLEAHVGGAIVNMSSIAGSSALGRGNFVYSVAKHGIVGLTRELAIEWAKDGIRVNAIQPCQFETPGLRPLLEDTSERARSMVDRFKSGIPLGRLGKPEDVVGPVIFLVSDAARMVTGILLPVDGGNLAMNAGASLAW